MDTQTQIERLIELAIVQRTELRELVEQLPTLREHLNAEIERTFEETEPQIRTELEEFCRARATDEHAKTGAALAAKVEQLSKQLEVTTAAKYSVLMAERAENANLLAKAEARIEDAASMLTHAVKEIVTDELSRFPRAGEIDQLRKEFAEPRGLNPRGRWMPDETYQRLDLVTINGDSFVSNIDGNRERPSRTAGDWTLSAARGNGGGGGGVTTMTDLVPVPSNGQLLIGNGSGFVNSTLTAGTGISISNGAGSITINATDGNITLDDGTAAAPSLNFTNEPTTGLFRASANVMGFAVAGTSRATMTATGMTVTGTITPSGSVHAASGTFGNPSLAFSADQTTGLYRIGASNIGVAAGGAKVLDVATTGLGVTGTLSVSGVATLGAGAILNTPASATLTNATGLPISTGVSGLGTNVATFLATPSSANLAAALTDETGTGALVFATSPTLVTPISATLTSPAATDLTLAGGSSGASLVLGQGTGYAVATSTDTGTAGEQIALVASATTSGTPTAGYGPSLRFFRKGNDGGAAGSAASVRAVAITGTGGSQYNSNLTLAARLAGNMVDVLTATGAGTVSIPSSTAGSASAGALVVTGGLATGAASYFGGAVTVAGLLQGIAAQGTNSYLALTTTGLVNTIVGFNDSGGTVTNIPNRHSYFGNLQTYPVAILTNGAVPAIFSSTGLAVTGALSTTGAATFGGAVTIGNTVNTVSPTSPNRTITMVVNGVTLYLAAKTTND